MLMACSGNGSKSETAFDENLINQQLIQDSLQKEAERIEAEKAELERIKQEQIEKERLEAEQLEAERVEAERVEAERVEAEQKKKEWNGVNSRSELKSKLDGTTWETVKPYSVTNLYYRFEIKGNKVIWSSAFPTRNYDDPKDWGNPVTFNIHDIAEPRQGTYCVILKAPDEDAIENAVPTILVFMGKNAYYSLGGEMGPALKKVK